MSYSKHLVLLTSVLIGCGGDDDGGGGVALANFGTVFGSEFCGKAFECCTMAEVSEFFDGAPFTTETECTNFYGGFFMSLATMYQASIDAGRLEYNANASQQCVTALRAQACADFARDDDPLKDNCPNPFVGKVANGMSCNMDEECVTGYCEGDSQFGNPMPGTCKHLPGSGAQCIDFTCADGFTCDSGTCEPLKADGASCFDGDECTSGGCNGAGSSTPGTCGAPQICNGQ